MDKKYKYDLTVRWTGNKGKGTSSYKAFERSYLVAAPNKVEIAGSSDPAFRGDENKYNPEELLVASLSSCHMLWYLHLCSEAGVVVTDYKDNATGLMTTNLDGSGRFEEVTLNPVVTVSEKSMVATANELHKKANEMCFIANSVKFPVHHSYECKSME
jgi:organic hydroperoxide reductase OsmC/OhrA